MSIGARATKIRSHPARLLVWRTLPSLLAFFSAASFQGVPLSEGSELVRQKDRSEPNVDAERSYLEDTPKQLVKHVPELKGVRPATDQQKLAMILKETGKEVDQFFDNVVDLVAHEEIEQERDGIGSAGRPVHDNYLIVRHKEDDGAARFDEFRMNDKGDRIGEGGPRPGFLVTSGFALIGMQFSSALQLDSRFRYVGDQKVAKRETYVVAFAQVPGEANLAITMRGPGGSEVQMLMQGVAWVDREDFHIVRMRTDLLSEEPESGLEEQTTKVDFSEVRLKDVTTPLWLPKEVVVYLKLGRVPGRPFGVRFKNVHHYTDYQRYRVTTKMVSPE